jgi:hypothetical protein
MIAMTTRSSMSVKPDFTPSRLKPYAIEFIGNVIYITTSLVNRNIHRITKSDSHLDSCLEVVVKYREQGNLRRAFWHHTVSRLSYWAGRASGLLLLSFL